MEIISDKYPTPPHLLLAIIMEAVATLLGQPLAPAQANLEDEVEETASTKDRRLMMAGVMMRSSARDQVSHRIGVVTTAHSIVSSAIQSILASHMTAQRKKDSYRSFGKYFLLFLRPYGERLH